MPWINLTLRRGALTPAVQHAMMAKLTEVLMWWEKVPDTPRARSIMKGWVYEVADLLAKQGLIRDFTRVVLHAEGTSVTPENARRVWVTINELRADDWGIGGHTDWLRDYTSALDEVGGYQTPS
jgi:phenylpyruvate tautomerase PptA (4-oxalocrotonate tautomerase family)